MFPNSQNQLKTGSRFFSLLMVIVLTIGAMAPFGVRSAYALDAPVPLNPPNGTQTTVNNYPPLAIPTFEWSSVAGAIVYRLEIANNIGFSPVHLSVTTANTRYTPPQTLFSDGNWYWRVRVELPEPVSNWSPIMQFSKLWASFNNAPILQAPANGAMLDFYEGDTFSWGFVTGAASYRFQIAATPDGFSSPLYTVDTLANRHQPAYKLANGTYYWRVVPIDVFNTLGTPSEVRSFTLAYGTAFFNEIPTQLEPANNSNPTFTPTFRWTAVRGADRYRLEYTTDENCDYSAGIAVEVNTTSFTPTGTFPNDARYCWHVRAQSGASIGDWSPTWYFTKRWYIQPTLLTPTNNYKYGLYPLYQWTPVPGAGYYYIEIARDANFQYLVDAGVTGNPYYTPRSYIGTVSTPYFWRVTPYDGSNYTGRVSTVFSWQSYYTSTAPILIYPFYYYAPNDYGGLAELNPHEDRTAAYPIFLWHRVNNPWPYGGTFADAYRIEVATTPYFGGDIVWSYDTENTSATPTVNDPFTPVANQDYFWRVCPLNQVGGSCLTNPYNNDPWWSQTWRARFNAALGLPPSSGAPELLRPEHGQEVVEATPLLEWRPVQGADQYRVQISRDPNFGSYEVQAETSIPAYSPSSSLAQRSLERLNYGTFYWRVSARVGGVYGDWSQVRRFQVASQSEWRYSRTLGSLLNRLQIGADPDDVGDNNYELTTLYGAQSNLYWYFGFNANLAVTNMTYVIYLDLDHVDGSGATAPPAERPYLVTTIPAHQPEYAIFIDQIGGAVSKNNTWIFQWTGSQWGYGQRLSDLSGGDLYSSSGYVELQIPATAIGMNPTTYSASLMLFSVNTSTGALQDSVPSDPNVPGSGLLSRFTGLTDRINLIYPPTIGGGDPTTIPSFVPFFWDYATGGDPSGSDPNPPNPWHGVRVEICLDEACTNRPGQFDLSSNARYFAMPNVAMLSDISGDTTYYWRVMQRYLSGGSYEGAWTGGFTFQREGFTPQNLQTSVNFATPIFSWDMVEGAQLYDLIVATDPSFNSGVVINTTTPLNRYIPPFTLAEDDYYWKVRIRRYGGVINDWSPTATFSLSLPTPTGLTIRDADNVVHYAPTMCWDHLIGYANGQAVITAYRYRVLVSKQPDFSQIWDWADTEQTCFTPTRGYDDGDYYWKVAMIDGSSRVGSYSQVAQFTKQYPVTTLVSPIGGSSGTPSFVWTPVNGAASYRLEVSANPNFQPLYEAVETVNTKYTPVFTYQGMPIFYWRVAIRDREGRYGPFTDALLIGDVYKTNLPLIQKK